MVERQTPWGLKPTSIAKDTLLSERTCTGNFGHGRITIHPDLSNRNASA